MEGKEVRFGIVRPRCSPSSPPAAPRARSTPCMTASLLSRHDSMINIQLGEIIVGGVGAGLTDAAVRRLSIFVAA